MTVDETIREIKQELHANMNGVASRYMRESGLAYHVNFRANEDNRLRFVECSRKCPRDNFGVELPRLREIASQFEPDHQVAQQLWHEDVRESKILATILMPVDRFLPDLCDIWVRQIPNAEVAQMAVLNLFSRLPYAMEKAFQWMAVDEPTLQLCGFLLVARLHLQGTTLTSRQLDELLDQAQATLPSADVHLRKAIHNALTHITGDRRSPQHQCRRY